jgi:hypothetical protein
MPTSLTGPLTRSKAPPTRSRPRVVAAARKLEIMGRDGDFDGAGQSLSRLEEEVECLVPALEARIETAHTDEAVTAPDRERQP